MLTLCDKYHKQIVDDYMLVIKEHVFQTVSIGEISRLTHSKKLIWNIEYAIEENLFVQNSVLRYTESMCLDTRHVMCEDFIAMYPSTKFELYDLFCPTGSDLEYEIFIYGRFMIGDGTCINAVLYISCQHPCEQLPVHPSPPHTPKIIWYSLPYFDNFNVTRRCFHSLYDKSPTRTMQKILTIDEAIIDIAEELHKFSVQFLCGDYYQ